MKTATSHQPLLTGRSAFTIIELTVVLAVIAALMGGMIALATVSLEERSYKATVAKLEVLQQALVDYRIAYNTLPCPSNSTAAVSDASFGIAITTTNCTGGTPAADIADATAAVGMVPVRTLGLPDEMAVDGWGRRIRYAVSSPFVVSDSFDATAPTSATARITVTNNESGSTLTDTAVFALISYGKNGHGARPGAIYGTATLSTPISGGITNTNELLNCKCNSDGSSNGSADLDAFVQGDPKPNSSNPLDNFDDIVLFSTRADLRDATE